MHELLKLYKPGDISVSLLHSLEACFQDNKVSKNTDVESLNVDEGTKVDGLHQINAHVEEKFIVDHRNFPLIGIFQKFFQVEDVTYVLVLV